MFTNIWGTILIKKKFLNYFHNSANEYHLFVSMPPQSPTQLTTTQWH